MTAPTALTGLPTTPAAPLPRDWRQDAACLDEDPELFFPVGTAEPALAQTAQAKKVCARCPVRATCLEWAMKQGQSSGVWGGLTEEERRLLKRRGRTRMPKANRKARHVNIVRQQLGEYLTLKAEGLTVEEIAAKLHAAPATIRKVQESLAAAS